MNRRFCKRCLWLAILSGIAGVALYLSSSAFSMRWHAYIGEQLEQRGIHADFERLSLNVLGGLVARDVRLYNDSAREQLLASVDRVNVEFDYGQLMRGKARVESFELSHANVALPVDSQDPALTVIEMRDFSARVYLRDRQLEVTHATGELAGIRVDLTADLTLGIAPDSEEKRRQQREAAMRRLEVVREYRAQIQLAIDWLARFEFKTPPVLVAQARGATESLEAIDVELNFSARDFGYRGYHCHELLAEAALTGGVLELRRLHLADALGSLDAAATWRRGEEMVNFRLASNADLTSAADVILSTDALREVVFYDQGPSLSLEGRWFFGKTGAAMKRPLDARGEIHCPRFTSRGEMFEGLSANFGVSADGFYVRDGMLRHRTGSLGLQFLLHERQGLRYRATLKMDPAAFKPFIAREQTRELIDRFKFDRDSSIYAKVEGKGPTAHFGDCVNTGVAELRGGEYRGLRFERADGRIEFQGAHLFFRDVKAELPEGLAEVAEVEVNNKEKWVRIKGGRAQCDPLLILRSFAPKVVEPVAVYRLTPDTVANVDGVFGFLSPERTDCRVVFAASSGNGTYRLWDRDYLIQTPQGELHFHKDNLDFDVRGQLFGGAMQAKGSTDLSKERDEFSVMVKAEAFEHAFFGRPLTFQKATANVGGKNGKITFDGSGSVFGSNATVKGTVQDSDGRNDLNVALSMDNLRWEVFGEELDFGQVSAQVNGFGDEYTFEAVSKLLGGQFEARGRADSTAERDTYSAEIKVNSLSFAEFARVYAPEYETEGDLTGHFHFEGVEGDAKLLRGEGVAIILNGNLYAVPILGPLTPLLGGFLPAPIKGYNLAKEANCTFKVQDGQIYTDDIEALTTAFRLVAKGNANFIENKIAFDAQARIRGLPGLVFRPVSELLEYQARGSIGEPQWKPRIFNLGGGAATTKAADPPPEAGTPSPMPTEETSERRRLRLPLFKSGGGAP